MAALIIAIFPQNSSRGNWEEQQDRTDPNSQFELARKPAWLLAFRQFGLPNWKHDFECCTIDHSDNSPSMRSTGFPDVFLLHIGTSWNMVEKPVSTRFQRGFGKRKERRKELHEEVLFESSKKLILMQVRKKGAPRGN